MSNRMQRLLALSQSKRQQARHVLARALAEQNSANAHAEKVEMLILGTGTPTGAASVAGLSAAAGLRSLLLPAQAAANGRAQATANATADAEAGLRTAEARHNRMEEIHADDLLKQDRKIELKIADDRTYRKWRPA